MFTDYTCFSFDLLDLCLSHDLAECYLDCSSSGPVDSAIAALRERLAEHWNPSDDLLRKVCAEAGAWDDLDTVDRITLIDRAIFCSVMDPLEGTEFMSACILSTYTKIVSSSDARFIRKLAQMHDHI